MMVSQRFFFFFFHLTILLCTVLFLVLFNFISMSCLCFLSFCFISVIQFLIFPNTASSCLQSFFGAFLWLPDLLFFSSNYWYVSLHKPKLQTLLYFFAFEVRNYVVGFSVLLSSASLLLLLLCCVFFVDMSFWYASEGFSLISLIKWKCFFFFNILLFASFSFNNFFLRFLQPISRNSCFLCFGCCSIVLFFYFCCCLALFKICLKKRINSFNLLLVFFL